MRNLSGSDPDRAWNEMQRVADQNLRAKDPVLHLIVSPAPEDRLTREQWTRLADRVLGDLGLGEHQALVVLHTDTGIPHLHLAVNRVHTQTANAWNAWRSKTRLTSILVAVEHEWGLRKVEGRFNPSEATLDGPRSQSRGERAQARHKATPPQIVEWRRTLTPHFRDATSWTDLTARLQGVNGVHHLRAQGRGLVVTDHEVYVKASSIDRSFSRARLEARFGQSFADWRSSLNKFDGAINTYLRHVPAAPDHPHAGAALRTLQSTGQTLGWKALAKLRGPLPAPIALIPLAARRRAQALDEGQASWSAFVERTLAPALARSGSWAEADARLRFYGAWLRAGDPKGRKLVITDGSNATPLRKLGPGLGDRDLTLRFGPWRTWQQTRHHIVSRADRLRRVEESLPARAERWTRLARLIQRHEVRLEHYRALRSENDTTEARLRTLLRRRRGGPRTAGALDRFLADLRSSPEESLQSLLSAQGRRGLGRLRASAAPTPELARAVADYRRLATQLARSEAPARGAHRRLDRLRHRARAINPSHARRRAESALAAAVRTAGRIGLASLVARAVPGFGPALTVLRWVARAGRSLAREDRGR
jgi:hypothetical protein